MSFSKWCYSGLVLYEFRELEIYRLYCANCQQFYLATFFHGKLLTNKAKHATAQNENLVSTSPVKIK